MDQLSFSAARLVAAAGLCGVGFFAAQQAVAQAGGTALRLEMPLLAAVLGAVIGWGSVGARAGRGWSFGLTAGLTGGGVLMAAALAIEASAQMFRNAMRNRYDGAGEALADVFVIALERARELFSWEALGVLLIGGAAVGLLTELSARRWS